MAAIVSAFSVSDEDKRRFAEVFVRTQNAATAAMSIITNTGEALRQSYLLPADSIVIEEIERIKGVIPEVDLLPTKAELAREVLSRARDTKDNEEYGKLMELYFKVMGMIEKPGTNVDVSVKVASVMIVKDKGTNEQWASGMEEQQRRLLIESSDVDDDRAED